MKETFSINELAMITGLSTRTLRNYLSMGVLKGEKADGAWTFTPEQVEEFTQNKAVQPSMRAKKHAIVYDFLGTKPFNGDRMCVVLDLTGEEAAGAPMFFCGRINGCTPEAELHFASEPMGKSVRLILSGSPKDVTDLVNGFYAR